MDRPDSLRSFKAAFRAVLVLLACLLAVQAYAGVTYYVDPANGNDSNNGTSPATAWRTITQLNANWRYFQTGDDVLLKRGGVFTDATLKIRQGGTSLDPAVIGAYGEGDKPLIDCGLNYLQGGILCTTPGLGYITIQDLAIRNVLYSNQSGITIASNLLTNITISRVDIDNIGNNGIHLARINAYTIENCLISRCANSGIAIIGSAADPITNGLIRNNTVHDVADNDGITIHVGSAETDKVGPNHTLIDNVGFRCAEQALDVTSGSRITLIHNESFDNGDSGVLLGHCSDVLIDKHFSHEDGTIGIIVGNESQNVRIQNSIITNASSHQLQIYNSSNVKVFHNTIVHGPLSTSSIIDIEGTSSVIAFKNNIVSSTQFSSPDRYVRYLGGITYASTKSDFSNNIWWRPDGGASGDSRIFYDASAGICTLSTWSSAYQTEAQSSFIDPQFALSNPADFSLRAGSPAIDTGAAVGVADDFDGVARPQGSSPDRGAFEFTAASAKLAASAGASSLSGRSPLLVDFTGSASGGAAPYSYRWTFGDGGASTSQNPSHTYASVGTYAATLTVTDNASATATSSLTISVTASVPLAAQAHATPTSGTAPLTVNFTGSVSGGAAPYSYRWTFGDGGSSTSQNPSHGYAAAGTYSATLTATDSASATASSSVTITVTAGAPLTARAEASPLSGQAPLAVTFTGSGSGGVAPYTYRWAFGDGATSTSQNPSHSYSSSGDYIAVVTVTDSASARASSSVTVTVQARPSLTAIASASRASGPAPLAVSFAGSASGGIAPYSYLWTFGDGGSSASRNPSHTYRSAGTYTAVLTVKDASSGTSSRTLTISVSGVSREVTKGDRRKPRPHGNGVLY